MCGMKLWMSWVAVISVCAAVPTVSQAQELDEDMTSLTMFEVQSRYQSNSATVYIDHEQGDTLQVVMTHTKSEFWEEPYTETRRPIVVVRVYEPDGDLALYRVVDTQADPVLFPALIADDLSRGLLLDERLLVSEEGVYEVRVTANWEGSVMHLGTSQPREVALSYNNGRFREWRPDPATPLYLSVPSQGAASGAEAEVRADITRDVVSFRQSERELSVGSNGDRITLDSGIWSVEPQGPNWRFRALLKNINSSAGVAPVITSTSEPLLTRLGLRGQAITQGPLQGDWVAHTHQRTFAEQLMPALLAIAQSVSPEELETQARAIYQDAACQGIADTRAREHARTLLGRIVPTIIYGVREGQFGLLSDDGELQLTDRPHAMTAVIAAVLATPNACNPWAVDRPGTAASRRALLARALLATTDWIMSMTEDERAPGWTEFSSFTLGGVAFALHDDSADYWRVHEATTEFEGELGAQVRAVFLEDLRRRGIDRFLPSSPGSNHNQSAHRLPVITFIGQVLGGDFSQMARAYTARFARGASQSGWYVEGYGPDASYQGITHSMFAQAYLLSAASPECEDSSLRLALEQGYGFMNLSVVREPNDELRSAYPFSYRTNWGADVEQFGGASFLALNVPEVAVRRMRRHPEQVQLDDLDLDGMIARAPGALTTVGAAALPLLNAVEASDLSRSAELLLPAEISERRTIVRGEDTIAVRRRGYYAMIHVNDTSTSAFSAFEQMTYASPGADCPEHYISYYEDGSEPIPSYNSKPCGSNGPTFKAHSPFVGGGLAMLWTPRYGSALLGVNWSPLVQHGFVSQRAGRRSWPNLRDSPIMTHPDEDTVVVVAALEVEGHDTDSARLSTQRTYRFEDDVVRVQLEVSNQTNEPLSVDRLWENIPVPVCFEQECGDHFKGSTTRIEDLSGQELVAGTHTRDGWRIVDAQGHGMAVEFDAPQEFIVRPVGLTKLLYSERSQIARVELVLPASYEPGSSQSFSYRLRPLGEDVIRQDTNPTFAPLDCPNKHVEPMPGDMGGMMQGDMGSAMSDMSSEPADMGPSMVADMSATMDQGGMQQDMSQVGGIPPGGKPGADDGCGCTQTSKTPPPGAWLWAMVCALCVMGRRQKRSGRDLEP